jgi:tetratricopeptide (TPR) repeat protein
LRRKAENRYAKKDYLVSEQSLTKAIDFYVDARDRNILKPSPVYGKLFSNLGDIYYYIENDLALAYDQFSLAEENGYTSPPLNYKKGFILYDQADYAGSLSEFTKAAGRYSGISTWLLNGECLLQAQRPGERRGLLPGHPA